MPSVLTKEQARKHVAANLQKAMTAKDLQQADLARAIKSPNEELQTARQRVYRYVNALADVVGDDLANMAEFLGVSTDWLLNNRSGKNSRRAG
jgi:transcriptional regulator with XRE-family HTH domain